MEGAFGHDFGDVRIHTDGVAGHSARSIQAAAYTVGSDIVFGAGNYAPGTSSGRHLLAHELAHVVQQRSGPVDGKPISGGLTLSDPSDRFERAADQTARSVTAARPGGRATEPTAREAVAPRVPSAQALLALQRAAGNAAVARWAQGLSRGKAPAAPHDGPAAASRSGVTSVASAPTGRSPSRQAARGPADAPKEVVTAIRSPGAALPGALRTKMEARFGHDFGRVNVHTGAAAATGAASVDAAAFTVGTDIVFGAGRYAPHTPAGFGLLAHELAHVVQGGGAPAPTTAGPLQVGRHDDPAERDADRAAVAVLEGRSGNVVARHGGVALLRRAPTFNAECGDWHRCAVTTAIDAAKPIVDTAISELAPLANGTVTSGRIVDLFRVHFHTFSAAEAAMVLGRFRSIRAELDAAILYECFKEDPQICLGRGYVGAFTSCSPGSDVGLCSVFWVVGCERRVHYVIHELAHHFMNICADPAYADSPAYMTLPSNVALENADSYAQFADMVSMRRPTCRACN